MVALEYWKSLQFEENQSTLEYFYFPFFHFTPIPLIRLALPLFVWVKCDIIFATNLWKYKHRMRLGLLRRVRECNLYVKLCYCFHFFDINYWCEEHKRRKWNGSVMCAVEWIERMVLKTPCACFKLFFVVFLSDFCDFHDFLAF